MAFRSVRHALILQGVTAPAFFLSPLVDALVDGSARTGTATFHACGHHVNDQQLVNRGAVDDVADGFAEYHRALAA